MRDFLKFFRIPLILLAILAVVTVIVRATAPKEAAVTYTRNNTECDTTERVFDDADVLTDEEENNLRTLISEKESETGCDIVIVTINQSLVEYAASYADQIGSVPIEKCVMVYSDNFFDQHKFGYNKPIGDGVVFLDNWYRESDGHVHSWLTTSGRAFDTYSSEMIDNLLNNLDYYDVDENPYDAYAAIVEQFADDMTGRSDKIQISGLFIFIAALVIALIFLIVNMIQRKGKDTTTVRTYMPVEPQMTRREDDFIRKTTTKRHIERDTSSGGSSGGGGGGHISAGGSSFGGGGHSR